MAQAKRLKSAPDQRSERENRGPEVSEDIPFQIRDWLAQRIGWGLLALLLLAGLVGLTGSGPLSHVTQSDGGGLTVEYDRFVRHGAQTQVMFRVTPDPSPEGQASLIVDGQYLVRNDLQRIVPEPNATLGWDDEVEFVFDVAPGQGLQVRWTVEPDELGSHTASVRMNDGPPVEIRQFTYP